VISNNKGGGAGSKQDKMVYFCLLSRKLEILRECNIFRADKKESPFPQLAPESVLYLMFSKKCASCLQTIITGTKGKATCHLPRKAPKCVEYRQEFLSASASPHPFLGMVIFCRYASSLILSLIIIIICLFFRPKLFFV
jgi:hypothetical protein